MRKKHQSRKINLHPRPAAETLQELINRGKSDPFDFRPSSIVITINEIVTNYLYLSFKI